MLARVVAASVRRQQNHHLPRILLLLLSDSSKALSKKFAVKFPKKKIPSTFFFFSVGFFVFLCRILVREELLACRQIVAGSELEHGGRDHGNYFSDGELQC
jgi:hypothetical protein